VVSADGQRRPLGVAGLKTLFRAQRSRHRGRRNLSGSFTTRQPDRESLRWEAGVTASASLLKGARPVHVADREADSYALFAGMQARADRFVVRLKHDRSARAAQAADGQMVEWSRLKGLIGAEQARLQRDVPLSARRGNAVPVGKPAHPKRPARLAKLQFAATAIELRRPRYFGTEYPASLTLNCVRVYEVEAPAGQEPVEWLLFTSEPITSPDDIARVVDFYRTRWVIEEYFKALKSGCIYEERQLESRHALLNALAIFLPIACHMLWLRSRAQFAPDAPATEVLTLTQILVLRAVAHRPVPANPTARDVLLAVAGIGGHLKNNGEPGWASIRHGLERLLDFEVGWQAARNPSGNMDQS